MPQTCPHEFSLIAGNQSNLMHQPIISQHRHSNRLVNNCQVFFKNFFYFIKQKNATKNCLPIVLLLLIKKTLATRYILLTHYNFRLCHNAKSQSLYLPASLYNAVYLSTNPICLLRYLHISYIMINL